MGAEHRKRMASKLKVQSFLMVQPRICTRPGYSLEPFFDAEDKLLTFILMG